MTIKITWSDGTITTETGTNPCRNQPEFTAEALYKLFCNMASWDKSQPQPINYEEI